MILHNNSLKNIDDEFLNLIVALCRKHPYAHISLNKHLQKVLEFPHKGFKSCGDNVQILKNGYFFIVIRFCYMTFTISLILCILP